MELVLGSCYPCLHFFTGGGLSVLQPPAQAVQLPPRQPFFQPFLSSQAQLPHPHLHKPAQHSPRGEVNPSLSFIARKLHKFIMQTAPTASPVYICCLGPGAENGSISKTLAHQHLLQQKENQPAKHSINMIAQTRLHLGTHAALTPALSTPKHTHAIQRGNHCIK